MTARVQQWANSGSANYGWRVDSTASPVNAKLFNSSEYTTDTSLRPKLTIIYN